MGDNQATARRYFAAIEAGATESALARFLAPDVIQEEFPNPIAPQRKRYDLSGILEAARRGQQVLSRQRCEVAQEIASG